MKALNNQSSPVIRLFFADKLKTALTMLVIAHHAGQPYGPTGGSWPVSNAVQSPLLGPFFAVNAAFFMGLFFLLSGYFVPGSYRKKGGGAFFKGRLIRLGIPTVIFAFFTFGPFWYYRLSGLHSFTRYVSYLFYHAWQPLYGHLWFLIHLLMYSLIYMGLSKIRPEIKAVGTTGKVRLSHKHILAYVILLAVATWIVRIWYPIDRWVAFLFLIPAEIAHLPQYLSLFLIGAWAYRHDWLRNTPARLGYVWLGIGLFFSAAVYLYVLVLVNYLPNIAATGGLSWQSFVYCLWEAFICAGLCVGLPVLFRETLNGEPGALVGALNVSAYGAYIIHITIVLAVQACLASAQCQPLVKFAIVTLAGIALGFGGSWLLRFIPGATKVL